MMTDALMVDTVGGCVDDCKGQCERHSGVHTQGTGTVVPRAEGAEVLSHGASDDVRSAAGFVPSRSELLLDSKQSAT